MKEIKSKDVEVGDIVELTKSNSNWSINMSQYDGQQLCVLRVYKAKGKTCINLKNLDSSKFSGDDWQWSADDGHFKIISRASNILNYEIY